MCKPRSRIYKCGVCSECGASSPWICKTKCKACYNREHRRLRNPTTTSEPSARRRTNDREAQLAVAWYSASTKIPMDEQRLIFAAHAQGIPHTEIARDLGRNHAEVSGLIQRGIISPRSVPAYRCGGCGNRVVSIPCFICESRRVHARREACELS